MTMKCHCDKCGAEAKAWTALGYSPFMCPPDWHENHTWHESGDSSTILHFCAACNKTMMKENARPQT